MQERSNGHYCGLERVRLLESSVLCVPREGSEERTVGALWPVWFPVSYPCWCFVLYVAFVYLATSSYL